MCVRSTVLAVLLLMVTASWAQSAEPTNGETPASPVSPSPPPPPPAVESPPAELGPKLADRAATPARFSRFSAGSGGPLYAFSQLVDGLVLGALLGGSLVTSGGATFGRGEAFVGALTGGLVLGGVHAVVQYFHPVGLAAAGTIALGTGVGVLAGFGVATLATVGSLATAALLALALSQVGAIVPLVALGAVEGDLSGEDLALMAMTSGYAFVVTGLVTLLFGNQVSGQGPLAAVLLAPAVGMGLGALWALGPDLSAGRILKLTALPLGVGLLTFFLGFLLAPGSAPLVAGATLLTTFVTFGVTFFVTSEEPASKPAPAGGPAVQPSMTITPAGWRNEGIALGPGLVGRF